MEVKHSTRCIAFGLYRQTIAIIRGDGRLKSIFTRELEKSGVPVGKRKDGSALIWQSRYWEHTIRDADDLNRHIDYIHFNPVKHGLVERVIDWPYSSFHRYVGQGLLPPNWAGENFDDMKLGEPDFKS